MKTSIWLVAIPEEFSVQRRIDLKVLMRRALRVEERMAKGVQLEDEQKRYHTLCDRIEYLGNLVSAECPVVSCELSNDYFEFLIFMSTKYPEESRTARLMSDFCPAERLSAQLDQFMVLCGKAGMSDRTDIKRKIEFYKNAIQNNWNIVEIIQQKTGDDNSFEIVEDSENLKSEFLSLKVADNVSDGQVKGPFANLRSQIAKSVSLVHQGMATSVDFGDLRHDVIAEILHEFVFKNGKALYLPVVYGDGSKAAPFPLFCLRDRSKEVDRILGKVPVLNVGMMSSRHHELDSRVKVYWYRNQEISIGRTMGESDAVAYEKAKELLIKTRSEGSYRIAYYQTGFQPAVVGFYRALTEELIYRSRQPVSIEVVPFYFMVGEYRRGMPWS